MRVTRTYPISESTIRNAVMAVVKEGGTAADVARLNKIPETALSNWVRRYKRGELRFESDSSDKPHIKSPPVFVPLERDEFKALVGEAIKEHVLSAPPLAQALDTLKQVIGEVIDTRLTPNDKFTRIIGEAVQEEFKKQDFVPRDEFVQLIGDAVQVAFTKSYMDLAIAKAELSQAQEQLRITAKKLELEHLLYADLQRKMQSYLEKAQESLCILRV